MGVGVAKNDDIVGVKGDARSRVSVGEPLQNTSFNGPLDEILFRNPILQNSYKPKETLDINTKQFYRIGTISMVTLLQAPYSGTC